MNILRNTETDLARIIRFDSIKENNQTRWLRMNESRLWFLVFVIVVTIGFIIIFINLLIPEGTVFPTGVVYTLQNGYRLLSILLGVLAGTALGELFKIRNNQKAGNTLYSDLIEELKVNREIIGTGIPLRKGFWILGIRSGKAEYLSDTARRELWEIYSRITHYNEDLQHLHRIELVRSHEITTSHMENELDTLCKEISTLITAFLSSRGLEAQSIPQNKGR